MWPFSKKKKEPAQALCLTDFYYKGVSYRANLDTISVEDPLFISQPYQFMRLEEDTNG